MDEIGDLNMASQVKLLRLIQDKEFLPLGSDKPAYSNARLVVATNRNLERMSQEGTFRKDLYFRIHAHHIHVPPLKERLEDLPLLVEHFLKEAAKDLGKRKPTVPEEIYTILQTYHFPGNIRELRSLVFDAVSKHSSGVMSLEVFRKVITPTKHQFGKPLSDHPTVTFGPELPSMKEVRRSLVDEAMDRANNNKTVAASLVGITRQSLSQYLQSSNKKDTE